MKYKKVLVVAATVGVFFSAGFGIKSMAEGFWNGHNHVQAINNDIDTLSDRIHAKTNTINRLNADLSTARTKVQNNADQLSKLTGQLIQVNQEKNLITNNNNVLNNQLKGKDSELQAKEQEIQAKIQEIQNKIQEGNDKVTAKQNELNTANQNIETLKAQVSDLQTKLSISDAALNDVKQARRKADQVVQETATSEQTPLTSNSSQNQAWEAKVYEAQARVSYNGKNYLAKWYASAQDKPGNGGPWEEYQEIN
ncbi:hypothetical protein EFL98_03835 [Lactococcus lactis]|uniref:hypothetical protein n=1 Tax=Lactococcus lactis TaxID=1358 RepID=UPI00223B9977|nr:hypothetical protein [Lactococcus lactis]MCT1191658.1 hypothetical protein [Lactococcus lactis]